MSVTIYPMGAHLAVRHRAPAAASAIIASPSARQEWYVEADILGVGPDCPPWLRADMRVVVPTLGGTRVQDRVYLIEWSSVVATVENAP